MHGGYQHAQTQSIEQRRTVSALRACGVVVTLGNDNTSCRVSDAARSDVRDMVETVETMILVNYRPDQAQGIIRVMIHFANEVSKALAVCSCKTCLPIRAALGAGAFRTAQLISAALGTNHELTESLFNLAREIRNRLGGQS